ncbi:MAG TPA: winged helix-turn-helix domain-containing protein [Pseudonocardiaceae bacterium]|jgi:ArsR family transcriptional regulator
MTRTLPRAQIGKIVLLAKAIGSEPRLEMLQAMRDSDGLAAAAGEVSEHGICLMLLARTVGIAAPTALRHLDVLVDAGLCAKTTVRHGSRYTYYRRDEQAIAEFADTVTRHL